MSKPQFGEFPEPKEFDRLYQRSRKFVDFCLSAKYSKKNKAHSLAQMISLERQKAVKDASITINATGISIPRLPKHYTRLGHLRAFLFGERGAI